MVLMGYLGARGTLIYEKNLKSKISCQTPFKEIQQGLGAKSYLARGLLIYEQIFAHFLILGSPSSYMTLHFPFEFPYI